MKYSALMIAGVMGLLGCSGMPQKGEAKVSPFATGWASTVMVSALGGSGTGVVISPMCVLTADHVVVDEKEIVVATESGAVGQVSIVKEDAERDLALICATEVIPAPVVARGVPAIDDPVYVPGYPLTYKVVTEGRYEGRGVVTASCAPGNSGGGVFNSEGQLVGLVDAIAVYPYKPGGVLDFPHLCVIVEMPAIEAFLGDVNGKAS